MGKAKNIKYSSKSSLGLSGLVMPPPHPNPHQEGRHTTQHTHFSRISFVKKPYLATRLKIFQNSVQMYNIQIYTRLLPKKDITIKDRDGLSVTYHRGHLNPRNMRGCWTTWKTHYITLCTWKYKKPTVPSGLFTGPLAGRKAIYQIMHIGELL